MLDNIKTEDLVRELEKRNYMCLHLDHVFAWKVWERDDIKDMIENMDLSEKEMEIAENPEFIDDVILHGGKWHRLTDCEDGEWDCICEEIKATLKGELRWQR